MTNNPTSQTTGDTHTLMLELIGSGRLREFVRCFIRMNSHQQWLLLRLAMVMVRDKP